MPELWAVGPLGQILSLEEEPAGEWASEWPPEGTQGAVKLEADIPGGRGGVGTVIIGPGQRSEPQCRYVTGQVIVERVDKGGSGSTAFLEFPVQPRGSLAGVGNAVANPHQGLYIRCPLAWGSGG